jgi:hypothetical protein
MSYFLILKYTQCYMKESSFLIFFVNGISSITRVRFNYSTNELELIDNAGVVEPGQIG